MVQQIDKDERYKQENHPTKRGLKTGRDKAVGIGRYPVTKLNGISVQNVSKAIGAYGRIDLSGLARFKV